MTTLFDQDYVTRMYGIEQREEGKRETAVKLLACHVDKEIIMKSTGLSLAEIIKLENGDKLRENL